MKKSDEMGQENERKLVQAMVEALEEDVTTGPCWVCGTSATERCDYREFPSRYTDPVCDRWLCFDHAVAEAQHWDRAGWDGVDVRCQAHRTLSLDGRDVLRGRGLPPAPRWAGTGLLTAFEGPATGQTEAEARDDGRLC